MAELFSLMPESTSCKADRVEATRTQYCFALDQWNAMATGLISRDTCSASRGAFSGRADGLAALSRKQSSTLIRRCAPPSPGGRRIKRCANAFSLREKVPDGRMRVLLCERILSLMSWNYLKDGWLPQLPKIEVPKRPLDQTHLAKNASVFKEFIF
ncbi:MAG: hypothetical protein ACYDC3_10190 [Candidatus Binataceae bacterium]